MIPSLVLALREGFEATLIIGIFFGVLRRMRRSDLYRPYWFGVLSAILVSILSALILQVLDKQLEGTTEKIFEGLTLLLAAAVLTWMIFWMRRESVNMKTHLESNLTRAAGLGGKKGVFTLAFIAVVREGIELALYLTAATLASDYIQTITGTIIGLFTACVLGYMIFTATIRINLHRFFTITGVILILFAAGLIAQSVAEFNEAGIIPAIINPIWNLNPFLNDQSIVGTIFNVLFGYHGSPSLTEAMGYSGYMLLTLFIFIKAKHWQVS